MYEKLLLGSISLLLFAISALLVQVSCQKDVHAQSSSYVLPAATTTSLGGVIVGNGLSVTSNGTLSVTAGTTTGLTLLNKILFAKEVPSIDVEIWTANADGQRMQTDPAHRR